MNNELKQQIISLCSVMSVSGFETRADGELEKRFGAAFDRSYTDAVGNHVYVRSCGRENASTILIDAHFDEIGMMITEVKEGGFLKFTRIGGLSPAVLQGADVMIYGKETLRGVIISTPPHLRVGGDDRLPGADDLMIDTGYSKEELEKLVPLGTPAGFAPYYTELMNGALAGKSFDDKACAAIAAYAILNTPKEKLAGDVALMLSCQEETSRLGGVAPGVFGLAPDYAMVIDVNLATVPDVPKNETVPMGKGVSLSVSAATDMALTRMTEELCIREEIAHVMAASPSSTGTNATTVQLIGEGVPTVDVGLPLRSMHTYNEVISMTDAESLKELVERFICSREIEERFGKNNGRREMPL